MKIRNTVLLAGSTSPQRPNAAAPRRSLAAPAAPEARAALLDPAAPLPCDPQPQLLGPPRQAELDPGELVPVECRTHPQTHVLQRAQPHQTAPGPATQR
jgi:hypothetical protein